MNYTVELVSESGSAEKLLICREKQLAIDVANLVEKYGKPVIYNNLTGEEVSRDNTTD